MPEVENTFLNFGAEDNGNEVSVILKNNTIKENNKSFIGDTSYIMN